MVNYKRVVCEVAAVLLIVAAACAAPAPAPDCEEKKIDQRQNGTENYRLNIDGVLIAVAPAESFLSASSYLGDLLDMAELDDYLKPNSDSMKPAKPVSDILNDKLSSEDTQKPEASPQRKDASVRKQEKVKRLKQRLANVLIPLLRKNRNH
ncbi:uncharacterized protein LOC116767517 [Danaus plexippus]|uniref:uncharacterized protein LOC116767517 n=1 Tax=Danaus plexippus TaxID=13037 RepID=UPI002AB2E494|nr:uncharacterized protein LOC116767517 [Danaus plexippus]